jgi:hypothetical protein
MACPSASHGNLFYINSKKEDSHWSHNSASPPEPLLIYLPLPQSVHALWSAPYLPPTFLLVTVFSSPTGFLYKYTFSCTYSITSKLLLKKMEQIEQNRVFRNVGNYKSDAGESPKRRHTIF